MKMVQWRLVAPKNKILDETTIRGYLRFLSGFEVFLLHRAINDFGLPKDTVYSVANLV